MFPPLIQIGTLTGHEYRGRGGRRLSSPPPHAAGSRWTCCWIQMEGGWEKGRSWIWPPRISVRCAVVVAAASGRRCWIRQLLIRRGRCLTATSPPPPLLRMYEQGQREKRENDRREGETHVPMTDDGGVDLVDESSSRTATRQGCRLLDFAPHPAEGRCLLL